ncbi:MAG: polysaccharide export protein [Burkholderiaceae bacterium]|nr:polysaccharide export protein [Burkholderiaceae bacterium]
MALCLAGLLAWAGASVAQEQSVLTAPPAPAPAGPMAVPGTAKPSIDDYRLGMHDLIEISVFQVPELSRIVRVNAAGKISLPMIGTVTAGGLTTAELEEEIAGRLAKNLLQDPQVTVFVKEGVSQRVVIEGQVKKNGVYALTGRTTLLQAIAMAEGLAPLANENEVKIFRQLDDGRKEMMVFDLENIRIGRAEDPLVKGNDVVVIEASATKSFIKNVTDTLRGFIGFGTVY